MNDRWITLKNITRQNKLIDIAPEHCFSVILADFVLIMVSTIGN